LPPKEEKKEDNEQEDKQPQNDRRKFIKLAGIGILSSVVAIKLRSLISPLKTLRPPGAVPENGFMSICNRCGRCIEVCPNKALHEMPIIYGMENYGTPYMIPREGNCCLCMSCVNACPTGALKPVQIQKVNIGIARIDTSKCIAWREHKLCLICVEQCPMGGVTQDDKHRPVIVPDKCVGCGSCEKCCALEGEAAIRVYPKED
jgi:ferredoxin-type protein NapH